MSQPVFAASGMQKIYGEVTEATPCTFNNPDASLTLPTGLVNDLQKAGQTSGTATTNITLSCDGSAQGTVALVFSSTNALWPSGTLKNELSDSTASKDVTLQLLDENGNPYKIGQGKLSQTIAKTIASTVTFPIGARYYSFGDAKVGLIKSSTQIIMIFN